MIPEKRLYFFAMSFSVTMVSWYGSPVRPRVMEAEIIHMIDNLDASMMMMSTALALVDKGDDQ